MLAHVASIQSELPSCSLHPLLSTRKSQKSWLENGARIEAQDGERD